MIEIYNLTKKFDGIIAVDNLNLSIRQGEFFGFIGPNGAGKTTTIKMLTGLLRPTEGNVKICGYTVSDAKDKTPEANIAKSLEGFIPDSPFLYEKLTGREFIEFIAGLYSVPKDIAMQRMNEYFSLFSISDVANTLIESYSHGMKQKVVMTAALIHNPKVLVVDEPMVGLDPKSVRIVKDLLKNKSKEGTTIFLSTHTLEIAEELCDRIGIIQKGKLIACGTIHELRHLAITEGGSKLEEIFLRLTEEEIK